MLLLRQRKGHHTVSFFRWRERFERERRRRERDVRDRSRCEVEGALRSGSNLGFDDRAPLGRGKLKPLVATVRRNACVPRESLLLRQKKSLIFKDFFHFHSQKIPYNPIRVNGRGNLQKIELSYLLFEGFVI